MSEIDAQDAAIRGDDSNVRGATALDATRRLPATSNAPRTGGPAEVHADTLQAERYADLERIAEGGMGVIYKAHDKRLRRDLAVKVLPADAVEEDPWAADRFLDEAQITAQLDHPGVVPVYELGARDDGGLFFAMKLVRGRTLSEVFQLARRKKDGWSLTKVVQLFLRICETMAFAHSKGVIHRDLKPANIMVGRFGEVYVMDWGVAKLADNPASQRGENRRKVRSVRTHRHQDGSNSSPSLTLFGDVLGTPAYMSPEQARGHHEELDARCDVYALGALLYEVLAGHAPYAGEADTARGLHAAVLCGPPAPLGTRAPDAPDELVAIVGKAMARQTADRYMDADALRGDLQAWLEGRVVSAHGAGTILELRKWVTRNRTLASVLLLSTILAIGGAIAFGVMQAKAAHSIAKERDLEQVARSRAVGERLSAQAIAIVDQDPGLALRLAIEGTRAAPGSNAARAALYKVIPEYTQRGVYEGHDGYVLRFDISRDETRIVSRAREEMLILWDLESTDIIARMMGHKTVPEGVRFVDQSASIVSWDKTGTVLIWDGQTGALRHTLQFTSDKPLVIGACAHRFEIGVGYTTAEGSNVALVDTRSGTTTSPTAVPGVCLAIGMVPGSDQHAILADTGSVHVASSDPTTPFSQSISLGDPKVLAKGRRQSMPEIHWDPENERALVGTPWSTIVSLDLATGETAWNLRHLSVRSATFVRDPLAAAGQLMILIDRLVDQNVAATVDRKTGKALHMKPLWSHFYSALPRKNWIAMRADSHVRLTDVKHRRIERDLSGHTYTTSDARGLKDARRIVTSAFDMKLRIWTMVGENDLRAARQDELQFVAHARNGGTYVFFADKQPQGGDRSPLVLRDATTDEERYRFEAGDREVVWMDIFDEGRRAVAVTPDYRTALFYHHGKFSHAERLPGRAGGMSSASADGRIVAFYGEEHRFWLCDATAPGSLQILDASPQRPHRLVMSPDGSKLLTLNAGSPRTARIWDRKTLTPLHELQGHNGYVLGGAFHPDGKTVATSAVDRSLRLWDVETGKLLHQCEGLEMVEGRVAFSPGGTYVSAATAGRTCVFETSTGDLHAVVNYVRQYANRQSVFSPDGSSFLTGDPYSGMRYWAMDPLSHAVGLNVPDLTDSQRAVYGLTDDGRSKQRAQDFLENTKSASRLSMMARSALRSGKIKRADALLERSLSIRQDLAFPHFVFAASQVRQGKFEAGLDSLRRSIDLGMQPSRQTLQLSPDFAAVRGHPRFQRILEGLK